MEKIPMPKELLKKGLLDELNHLKKDFFDGIPEEVKHSTSKDSGWKVQRGAWFQVISGDLANIIVKRRNGDISISDELFDEIVAYNEKLTNDDNPLKHELTKQEDINEAEAMIDKIIAELV